MSHDLDDKREWEECLRVEGVILPTGYFFGASATTGKKVRKMAPFPFPSFTFDFLFPGDLSDNHDIISMKAYELDVTDAQLREDRSKVAPSSSFFESPRDHVDDPKPSAMSGVKTFFLLLLGGLGCVACVVIGIMIYQKQQDNSRKRFY